MARGPDLLSVVFVLAGLLALAYGVWQLAAPADLWALYWLGLGGLLLKAAGDRERCLASR